MALSQQAVESMLKAMDIIATNQFNSVSYDQTVVCTITDRSAASKQFYYTVTDGSAKFKAYVLSTQEAEEYDVNDQVYVKIPNGDYSKKKYIEGYYISEDSVVPITYVSPFDTFLDMADLTKTTLSEGLVANRTAAIPIWQWSIDEASADTSDDLQANGIYDTLGIQADFKCLLNSYNMRAGSYGLRLDLYVRLSTKSDKHITKSVYLDSSEMFGNPYAFTIFATQAKTFDIASIGTIDGMTLWFYQNNDFVYFDGQKEKFLEVDERLLTPNIFVNNVYVAFGSELSKVTDNTIKLYSTNDLSFKQTEPSDVNNTKTLGFLWYNKTQEGKYIGFSDGVVDFKRDNNGNKITPETIDPYDELEYLALSAEDNRLLGQMGKDVPKDTNGLEVSANVSEGKELLKKAYTLIQTDLVNTLKAFKERVAGLSIKNGDTWTTANDYFLDEDFGKINIAIKYGENLETQTDVFITQMTDAMSAAAAIQKHQTEKTTPEKVKTVTSMNLYSSNIKNLLLDLTREMYTMIGANQDKREFLFNDLRLTIAENYSGFQSVYDTYNIKLDKIFTSLEKYFVEIDALLKDVEARMTSTNKTGVTSGYQYVFDKTIETYTERDFSSYHNKYCVYWYRFKDGYIDSEGLMDDGWERISPEMVFKDTSYSTTSIPANLGLSSKYTTEGGVDYFVPKPASGEGYLSVYLTPDIATEKFKVVIYYNHERFDSNELVFTNLDPVVDKTTLDTNDAIIIKHGTNSFDSYQTSYAQNNSLLNGRDASMIRTLQLEYDGVLGGNENLAGAQIYWYIPRNATMLNVDVNNLKGTHGFSTDFYRVAEVPSDGEGFAARQGPGNDYKETEDVYLPGDKIEAIYDQQNGWYSLRSSNSIGASGRWIPGDKVTVIDNADTYMDGFACFYKTIPFKEEEVDVYDETDPTVVIGTKKVQVVDTKDLQFYYKIKDYYVATSLKNTIFCIVKKDDYQFETSISFVFGTQGTSGTDYTLIVTPSDTQTAVTNSKLLPVHVKAYNYDNEEIDIHATTSALEDGTLYNPKVSWFGPTTFSMAALNDEDADTSKVVNAGEISVLDSRVYESNLVSQYNYCGIAKLTVNMFDTEYGSGVKELSTLYPVAWSAGDYYIEGATSVVYDSSGANPVYYKDSYRIFKNNTNEEMTDVTWDIKYFMLADASKHGYSPKYMFDIAKDGKISIWDVSKDWSTTITVSNDLKNEIVFYAKYVPILSEGDNKLKPRNNYITGTYNEVTKAWTDLNVYPVVCCYDKVGTQIWAQPILISQNRYPNSMLNHWDGKLEIDEENGTILSTMVSAGFKNTDNTYSGVLMGDIEAGSTSDDNKDGVGVFGYHHGAQSFGLNIDGTAFFGKSGRGRIKIDGNKGTISSASYQQTRTKIDDGYGPAEAGMMIDLDDGFIDMLGTEAIDDETYKPDGTQSRVHANVQSPYFFIVSDTGHRLINIGNSEETIDIDGYDSAETSGDNIDRERVSIHDGRSLTNFDKGFYLKSNNFKNFEFVKTDGTPNEGGAGFFLDLATGRMNSFNLNIASKNLLIDSDNEADPFFIIKDDDGCNLMYVGQTDFYLQSHTYARRVLGDIDGTNEEGSTIYHPGMKINTDGNDFLFDIQGQYQSLFKVQPGEFYLQTDDYRVYIPNDDDDKVVYGRGLRLDLSRRVLEGKEDEMYPSAIDAYDFQIKGMNSLNETWKSSYFLFDSSPKLQMYLTDREEDGTNLFILNIDPINDNFLLQSPDWLEGVASTAQADGYKVIVETLNIRDDRNGNIIGSLSKGDTFVSYGTHSASSWWIAINEAKTQWCCRYDGSESSPTVEACKVNVTTTDGMSGMQIDVMNGSIVFNKQSDTNNSLDEALVINAGNATYPLQIGTASSGHGKDAVRNFRVKWDGSLYGGSTYKWSINANGEANFKKLNSSGGSLSWCYIYNATMNTATITNVDIKTGTIAGMTFADGGITAGTWTLSSAGLSHSTEGTLTLRNTSLISVIAGSYKNVAANWDAKTLSGSCSVTFENWLGQTTTYNGTCSVTLPASTSTQVVGSLAWYSKPIEYYGMTPASDGGVQSPRAAS